MENTWNSKEEETGEAGIDKTNMLQYITAGMQRLLFKMVTELLHLDQPCRVQPDVFLC